MELSSITTPGGRIVSIEILDATDMVDNPYSVEVEVAKETVVAA